jgi:phage-related protein
MKAVRVHKLAAKEIEKLSPSIRIRIAELLDLIAHGESLGMPVSRPMPAIATGVHELRVKDASGQYRVFYYTKVKDQILVFHCFNKKTQVTPKRDLELAKKRLKELL